MIGQKYIYNIAQANFFISKGAKVKEVGYNAKSQKTYVLFNYYDLQPLYEEWESYKERINLI